MSASSPFAAPAGRIPALNWHDAHRCEIQMRYGDVDAMGHVNNARYAEYLEVARMAMSRELDLGEADALSVLARLELDYVSEVRLGETLVVESLVERIGRTSWTVVSRFTADGRPCAFARSVQVGIGEDRRPKPVPESFLQRVEHLRVRP